MFRNYYSGIFSHIIIIRFENTIKYRKKIKFVYNIFTVTGPDNSEDSHNPLMLDILDLSYNGIDKLDSHAFNHLAKLKKLVMTDNNIYDFTVSTLKAFNELESIEELDLSRNQLVRIPDHFCSGMRYEVLTFKLKILFC